MPTFTLDNFDEAIVESARSKDGGEGGDGTTRSAVELGESADPLLETNKGNKDTPENGQHHSLNGVKEEPLKSHTTKLTNGDNTKSTTKPSALIPKLSLGRLRTVDLGEPDMGDDGIFGDPSSHYNNSGATSFSYLFKNGQFSSFRSSDQSDKRSLNLKLIGIILVISIISYILGLVTGVILDFEE